MSSLQLVASGAGHVGRVRPDRVGDPALGAVRRHGEGPERPGQPGQRRGEQRRAAPVDRGDGDRLARELGEGVARSPAGAGGPATVGRGVPAVDDAGQQHRGVLARAVHGQRARLLRRPGSPRSARLSSSGQSGGVWQRRLVQPAEREDPAYAVEVERLPAVRGARQREQLGREVEAEPDHPERLQRLVARPREHRLDDLAHRPVPRAVRSERHHRAVVVTLDEAGADDLGEDDGGGHGGQATDPTRVDHLGRHCPALAGCSCADSPRATALPDAGRARRPRAAGQRRARRPRAFNQPGSPVTLTLPDDVAAQAAGGRRGRAGRPRGPAARPGLLARRRSSTRSPTRSSARSAGCTSPRPTTAQSHAGRTVVPVVDALTEAQLDELARLGPVALLAFIGTRHPRRSPRSRWSAPPSPRPRCSPTPWS